MDCQLFERQAQRSIDGLLAAREHEDMLRHAATCPVCAALLQDLKTLDSLLGDRLVAVGAPEGFAEAVMAALPAPYRKQSLLRFVPRQRVLRFGSMAAAAVLLVTAGVYSLWPSAPVTGPTDGPNPPSIVAQDPSPAVTPQPKPQPKPVTPQPQQPLEDPLDEPPAIEEDPLPAENPDPIEQQPQTPVEEPPVIAQVEEPVPYTASVEMPGPAAYTPQASGMLALTLLAGYEDCDAQYPSFNEEGLVVFYIKFKGIVHQWTQSLAANVAPEYVGQVKALPTLAEITGALDESALAGYPYMSALSPDGRVLAVNQGGDYQGVWLFEATAALEATPEEEAGTEIAEGHGGGKVLNWSPDGNKLLYTDEAGKLFVHYLYMPTPYSLELYAGNVSCASWSADGKTVVFAGKAEKNGKSAIFSIIIP